jgi:F-type H+-transporting ATPase subunit b
LVPYNLGCLVLEQKAFTLNIDNYLRINLTDMIMVLISTFLIILFAKKYFWDKIVAFVKKRQDLIQQNIDSSEALKAEAQAQKDKYDEQMRGAGKEAHAILAMARNDADEERERILAQAQNEAARLKEQAQEEIERDKRQAQKDMKAAISDVAMEAAKKLVDKEMDEKTQRKFVDDFIQQAGDQTW